jgi:hypothetical protein
VPRQVRARHSRSRSYALPHGLRWSFVPITVRQRTDSPQTKLYPESMQIDSITP